MAKWYAGVITANSIDVPVRAHQIKPKDAVETALDAKAGSGEDDDA